MNPIRRIPWDDFPQAWIHASESTVKKHPAYIMAKAGDPDAAFRLVDDLISVALILK